MSARHAPISGIYTHREADGAEVRLRVRSDLLIALLGSGVQIQAAAWNESEWTYKPVQIANLEKGEIRLEAVEVDSSYMIVTDQLLHAFPVVTNWDASLNNGRGGMRPGATDGIGQLRLNRMGETEIELPLRDTDSPGPYLYRTDRYALFTSEPEGEYLRVTAYEQYIGEGYSLYSVDEAVVNKLSNDCLNLTGYPVVLRRPDAKEIEWEDVPAFQLFHGVIVRAGGHYSMASFFLPPYWRRSATERYPALFSGFYDQNENVFASVGPSLLKALGRSLLHTGTGAVGIIWNGGGSIGTRTLQGSVYDGLNELFRTARQRFSVDTSSIVACGGSRGAITGLMAAGNPKADGYSVPYLICYNPPLFFGDSHDEILNPTFPIRWEAIASDIGYKDAWKLNWRDPEGNSAISRFLINQFGTDDSAVIAKELSPASDQIIGRLKCQGTKVFLTHGTHDVFTASWPAYEWVSRARRYGVQVSHEIGYRFGHNNCTDLYERAAACLNALLLNEQLSADGTHHYRRTSEAVDAWEKAERFEPAAQPVYFEGPKIAVPGLPLYLAVYGEPGMYYSLMLQSASCNKAQTLILMEGVLDQLDRFGATFSYKKVVQEIPECLTPGQYVYTLRYRRIGEAVWSTAEQLPHPGQSGIAVLQVLDDVPNFIEDSWLQQTMAHFIGWGLSEH